MHPATLLIRSRLPLLFVLVSLTVLATMVSPAPALQQKPAANAGNPSTVEDFRAGDESRERYQRATDVLKALVVTRGDWVADVGAGAGYYAVRLSEIVGTEGKVFAEDISDSAIGWLNRRVQVFHLSNVEVVRGEVDNPELPPDSLAAILIVDAYHHFTQHEPMLQQIFYALKPGGRLVIADYSSPEHRKLSRADQLKIHEIDPDLVRAEVGRVGFEVVTYEDPFMKRMPDVHDSRIGAADMWLMVAVRPQ